MNAKNKAEFLNLHGERVEYKSTIDVSPLVQTLADEPVARGSVQDIVKLSTLVIAECLDNILEELRRITDTVDPSGRRTEQ